MNKILLVDDFEMIREAIIDYLEDEENFKVTGQAENGAKALEELEKNDYDLLITDISMPEMDGITLLNEANKKYPDLKILVLTMYHDQDIIRKCLQCKINGYMAKNSEREKVINAINLVLEGKQFWDDDIEPLGELIKTR